MDIIELIEELEDVLDDASNIPFSKKVAVDPDEVFEIVKEIHASLPEEIRQAKWVNEEKDRILQEANNQAADIIQQASKQKDNFDQELQKKYEAMINEHSIAKEATRLGEEIVANAEKQARQIKLGTFAYVDEILKNTQENLKTIVKELDNNRQELK